MFSEFNANNLVILLSLIFTVLAFILIFLAVREAWQDHRLIKKRLKGNWSDKNTETILKTNKAFENFANHLTLPDEEEISKIRARLARAGFYGTSSVKYYYAVRILAIVVPLLVFLTSWGFFQIQLEPAKIALICVGLILGGLMAPTFFVSWRESAQTQVNRNGFPDMMDLLVACIEAGLGMNAALLRVADEIGGRYPPLKISLDLLNLELRAGRERNQGMLNFAKRVNLEEAKALAVMIRQSEEMGSSLGKSLRSFADEMRNKRKMTAEEKAMALPAKMTVPLILFIFPAIIAMLMTPAAIRVMEGLGI